MAEMNKPLIFITNDDGVDAPGLRALIEIAKPLGNIIVLAPESGQSGMSHALTVKDVLRIQKIHSEPSLDIYKCNGTPVDCLKLARHKILDKNPDICLSGINHGSNSSINVIYSGTVAAAQEGSMYGIPSIAFSLNDFSYNADFSSKKDFILRIINAVFENGLPADICLNVNIPKLHGSEIQGIKFARQAKARWNDNYDERYDPFGRSYYWLTGNFASEESHEDTDEWALANAYISIVPVQIDYTSHAHLESMKKWTL